MLDFLNPFYQKDEDYISFHGEMTHTGNTLVPMTDYIHLTIFKEHFFKWNSEYKFGLHLASGTAQEQLDKIMMRDMDKLLENIELKKLIKSMCQEIADKNTRITEKPEKNPKRKKSIEIVIQNKSTRFSNSKNSTPEGENDSIGNPLL